MSPQVSRPRRKLPTGISSTLRFCTRRNWTSDSAVAAVSLTSAARRLSNAPRSRLAVLHFFLAPHPFQRAQLSGLRRRPELVDALDVQRRIEHGDGLRADALEAQEVEDRPGNCSRSSSGTHCRLCRQARGCGRRGPYRFRVWPAVAARRVGRSREARSQASGCRPVCPYLECVIPPDFEQVGDLGAEPGTVPDYPRPSP